MIKIILIALLALTLTNCSKTLTGKADKDKVYIKACLRKGEKLTETPRIRISTIHSSKGSQSENVMLLTETMKRPYSMWRKNNSFEEDEARVFYVGLTRSQQNLHLIHPMFSQGYPLPVR